MGERSKYSEAQRLAALAYYKQDGRIKQTAQAFNLPYKTVQNWIVEYREQGEETLADTEEQMAVYKKALTAEMRRVMGLALKQVVTKLDGATAYQATTIFGILFDKVNIMEGTATPAGGNLTINNTIINQMPDQEAEKLMAKALQRMQGKVIEASYNVEPDQNNTSDNSSQQEE